MGDLKIEPLQEHEMDESIRVYWDAFEPAEKDMIMPMMFPRGLQPDLVQRTRGRMLRETGGDIGSWCFACKDTRTGEILGIAWWGTVMDPPRSKEQIDAGYQKAVQDRMGGGQPVAGANEALIDAFNRVVYYEEAETMAPYGPYVILKLLAVGTRHQRRGVGSMLLKHGFEKFDPLGLPTYLDSGVSGKPLYERFGFRPTKEWPLDSRDYGGRSPGRHWCMVRPNPL